MNNVEFSEKMAALSVTQNRDLRKALKFVLQAVQQDKDKALDPQIKYRLEFNLGGFAHFPAFKKALLNQPLLLNELFPGKSLKEIEKALSGITSGDRPWLNTLYSMMSSKLLLAELNEYSDDILAQYSQKLEPSGNHPFIYQLINQEDARTVKQEIAVVQSRRQKTKAFVTNIENVFPLKNLELRVAFVSVLKAVLLDRVGGLQEILNQPLLMEALFPGKGPEEIEKELSDMTLHDEPSMNALYSWIVADFMLSDLYSFRDESLAKYAQKLEFPSQLQGIYQLMNQEDANFVKQEMEIALARRQGLSPISDITPNTEEGGVESGSDSDSDSDATKDLYPPQRSSFSHEQRSPTAGPINNAALAKKLAALPLATNSDLRKALKSVLQAVRQDQLPDPNRRFEFSLGGFKHFPVFKKALLKQPLLMEALFPGKSPKEIEQALSGITSGDRPSLNTLYSMMSSDLILAELNDYSDENLIECSQRLDAPSNLPFIEQLMSQEDANTVKQEIVVVQSRRQELSPLSDITFNSENESVPSISGSDVTEALYLPKRSGSSPARPAPAPESIPDLVVGITNKDGRILWSDLYMLGEGCTRKVTPNQINESLTTLRFIYRELKKEPGNRIDALKEIIDDVHSHPAGEKNIVDKSDEKRLCNVIVRRLKSYFGTTVDAKGDAKFDPRVSQEKYKRVIAARQDGTSQSDDKTHVSRYKASK